MDLPDCMLVVRAEVAVEVESAWNRWYNEVHLPEITACPGFISSRRYKAESAQGRHYIALYALERPEALESAEFAARRGWAEFTPHVSATVEVCGAIPGGSQP